MDIHVEPPCIPFYHKYSRAWVHGRLELGCVATTYIHVHVYPNKLMGGGKEGKCSPLPHNYNSHLNVRLHYTMSYMDT